MVPGEGSPDARLMLVGDGRARRGRASLADAGRSATLHVEAREP
jgi:hypothetical protein